MPFAHAMRQARQELDPDYGARRGVTASSAWMPVTEDMLVDAGHHVLGYDERAYERKMEAERYWRSLPWHVRLSRTFDGWRWRQRERLLEAIHRRLYPGCDRGG